MADKEIQLGAFSTSLAVKDLQLSVAFYKKLGFDITGGDGEHYAIMVNGLTVIGMFQGMFDKNILTFNPGLSQDKDVLKDFTDVREIQAMLLAAGIEMTNETDPNGTGPASIAFLDPDGNPVLIDQFFPKPGTDGESLLELENDGAENG